MIRAFLKRAKHAVEGSGVFLHRDHDRNGCILCRICCSVLSADQHDARQYLSARSAGAMNLSDRYVEILQRDAFAWLR